MCRFIAGLSTGSTVTAGEQCQTMRILPALVFGFLLTACKEAPKDPEIAYPEEATVLTVKGMHCGNCKATVTRALSKVEGVEWAQIEQELGQVAYSGSAEVSEVVTAIEEAGYEVQE